MSRLQFTLRALLVALLVVGAFFAGIHIERERCRQEDDAQEILPAKPGVLTVKPPFTRVYPVEGPDGEQTWSTEPPTGSSD
ncbi:MAG TPA: hypothetical protein VFI31_11710 [Pirellulales bacterium]|nr:hypothetical protein [Pirellulales bacterium]